MPISTSAEAWKEGGPVTDLGKHIIVFLSQHPNMAFTSLEIADELADTDWATAHERWRLKEQVSDEEFLERFHAGETPGGKELDTRDFGIPTARIELRLAELVREGAVTAKVVDSEPFNLPIVDKIEAYTLSTEFSSQTEH